MDCILCIIKERKNYTVLVLYSWATILGSSILTEKKIYKGRINTGSNCLLRIRYKTAFLLASLFSY